MRDQQPSDEDHPEMRGRVATEPTDRPDVHCVRILLPRLAPAEPPFLNDTHQISTAFRFIGELPPFS